MKRNLYHVKAVLLALCVTLALAGAAFAQGGNNQQTPKPSKDEEKAAVKIKQATTLEAKFLATEEYLKKFSKGVMRQQVAEEMAMEISKLQDPNQIVSFGEKFFSLFTEPKEIDLVIPDLVTNYLKTKKFDEAFQTGDNFLSRHPEDVHFFTQLALDGANLFRQGNNKFVKQSADYANKAIALIEADKKPASMDDATWASYKTTNLSALYQSLGVISMMSNNPADAKTKFEKAVAASATDPVNYYFLGYIADGEYQVTVKAYQASQPGKQRDDLLTKANTQIDTVIDYYARAVAMAESNPQYHAMGAQVRADLETYYKYRHKSLNGLEELINKYKPLTLKP